MSIFERVSEHSYELDVQRGLEAKSILATDTWYEALEEAELNFLEEMKYGETVDKRERAHAKVMALDGVLIALRKIQSEGEYAEEVLKLRREAGL